MCERLEVGSILTQTGQQRKRWKRDGGRLFLGQARKRHTHKQKPTKSAFRRMEVGALYVHDSYLCTSHKPLNTAGGEKDRQYVHHRV